MRVETSSKNRVARALLPIPERPWSIATTGGPLVLASKAACSSASSDRRPTKGCSIDDEGGAGSPPCRRSRTSSAAGRAVGSTCRRSRHSFSRSGGTPTTKSDGRTARACCLARRTWRVSPSNGRRSVSASKRMTPTAYQSAGGPGSRKDTCSGAMYAGVPTIGSSLRAPPGAERYSPTTPKSSSTTRPPVVTMTFEGLMSRCSLPAAWIAATPAPSWRSALRRRPSSRTAKGLRTRGAGSRSLTGARSMSAS